VKEAPPEIDLRPICRRSDKIQATVYMDPPYEGQSVWLRLGEVQLIPRDGHRFTGWWTLKAYMGPENDKRGTPTDGEHDSAYACQLPLIGVTMGMVMYHTTLITAYVNPALDLDDDHNGFYVPTSSDYDPRKHPDAEECDNEDCLKEDPKDGNGPHILVPEGFYVPPYNRELYERVRGQRVEIRIGQANDE
jgi:hypothetical protein